jgi:cold shock protein
MRATRGQEGGDVARWVIVMRQRIRFLMSKCVSFVAASHNHHKGHCAMERGTVKWFNNAKGYGFITRESGEDLFVHFKSIVGEGYKTLKQGEGVDFEIEQGTKGLQATNVRKVMR